MEARQGKWELLDPVRALTFWPLLLVVPGLVFGLEVGGRTVGSWVAGPSKGTFTGPFIDGAVPLLLFVIAGYAAVIPFAVRAFFFLFERDRSDLPSKTRRRIWRQVILSAVVVIGPWMPYGFWEAPTVFLVGAGRHQYDWLMAAAYNGSPATLFTLVKQGGVPVGLTEAQGETALHQAAAAADARTVRWLIDHNADIEATDASGSTPIFASVVKSNFATLETLIERGANLRHVRNDGKSMIDVARDQGNAAVIARIEQALAKR